MESKSVFSWLTWQRLKVFSCEKWWSSPQRWTVYFARDGWSSEKIETYDIVEIGQRKESQFSNIRDLMPNGLENGSALVPVLQ